MSIEIVTATDNPMDVISVAAGTSYGKRDAKPNRVRACFKAGHMSVFEQASVTFRVNGISRACSHQLVRHRMASFVQVSQRYTTIDTASDWYVMPDSFEWEQESEFRKTMNVLASRYNQAINAGIKPEDARYLLPEATRTELTVTMNVRELFHFLGLRTASDAQWEIRRMAEELAEKVAGISDQWAEVMGLWKEGKR